MPVGILDAIVIFLAAVRRLEVLIVRTTVNMRTDPAPRRQKAGSSKSHTTPNWTVLRLTFI